MATPGVTLGPETYARMMEAVRYVEGLRRGEGWMRGGYPNTVSPVLHTVRVTSTTRGPAGRFPGVWLLHSAADVEFVEQQEVWIEPRHAEELCRGDYLAWRSADANGRPVFIVDETTQVIKITSATPAGGFYDAVLKQIDDGGVPAGDQAVIKAYDLSGSTELAVGARYLARLSSNPARPRVYIFRSETFASIGGGFSFYEDMSIGDVSTTNINEGHIVVILNTTTMVTTRYMWACFASVGCGWINLCDCVSDFVPSLVETTCCPDKQIPDTLLVTLTSTDCAFLDGVTFEITFTASGYSAGETGIQWGVWSGDVDLTGYGGSGTLHFEAYCSSNGGYHWGYYMDACGVPTAAGSLTLVDCDPFELTGSAVNFDGCGCDAADTVTFTITEVP